jgi:protein TonB
LRERRSAGSFRNLLNDQIVMPRYIPTTTPRINDLADVSPAPDITNVRRGGGNTDGVPNGPEGNLIYRVQPIYPPLARQARIQGPVQLRAIVSKSGTIERLTVESGHPMLSGAAIDVVRQWRYRPYLLNDEPVEIETEITVNFVLSGS